MTPEIDKGGITYKYTRDLKGKSAQDVAQIIFEWREDEEQAICHSTYLPRSSSGFGTKDPSRLGSLRLRSPA